MSGASVRVAGRDWRRGAAAVGFAELKSDLLLVRPEGSEAWIQFRDDRPLDIAAHPATASSDQLER